MVLMHSVSSKFAGYMYTRRVWDFLRSKQEDIIRQLIGDVPSLLTQLQEHEVCLFHEGVAEQHKIADLTRDGFGDGVGLTLTHADFHPLVNTDSFLQTLDPADQALLERFSSGTYDLTKEDWDQIFDHLELCKLVEEHVREVIMPSHISSSTYRHLKQIQPIKPVNKATIIFHGAGCCTSNIRDDIYTAVQNALTHPLFQKVVMVNYCPGAKDLVARGAGLPTPVTIQRPGSSLPPTWLGCLPNETNKFKFNYSVGLSMVVWYGSSTDTDVTVDVEFAFHQNPDVYHILPRETPLQNSSHLALSPTLNFAIILRRSDMQPSINLLKMYNILQYAATHHHEEEDLIIIRQQLAVTEWHWYTFAVKVTETFQIEITAEDIGEVNSRPDLAHVTVVQQPQLPPPISLTLPEQQPERHSSPPPPKRAKTWRFELGMVPPQQLHNGKALCGVRTTKNGGRPCSKTTKQLHRFCLHHQGRTLAQLDGDAALKSAYIQKLERDQLTFDWNALE
jgi:hypothetical protein